MIATLRRRRSGISLVEILIATAIAGILSGLAIPTVLGARRNAVASLALADLRLVDIAINASCSRGVCGPFNLPGSYGGTVSIVPDAIKEFLPTGYKFSTDTSVYAIEMESWEFVGGGLTGGAGGPLMCVSSCGGNTAPIAATSTEDTGFENTAGFTAPPTIYVTVTILTKDGDMAQRLYDKAGGTPPYYLPTQQVWRYSFPVLIGVPNIG